MDQPALYVHNAKEIVDPLVLNFVNQYEYELYEQFTFEWVDIDHMYFHDKKDSLWHILCSFDARITDQIMNQYAIIVAQKKIIQEHIVDVRFSDQIVVYQDRGEQYG